MKIFDQLITFKYRDTEYTTRVYVRELVPSGYKFYIRFKTGGRSFQVWNDVMHITLGKPLDEGLVKVIHTAINEQVQLT